MPSDELDLTDHFNTPLTPEQEAQFRQAYPDAAGTYDYDLRGAWLAGAEQAANGHLPDTFKKPNHPTFSNESQYSRGPMIGGRWVKGPDGKYAFLASPVNLSARSPEALQEYFATTEPDVTLVLPKTGFRWKDAKK